jgi:hypothetical protein
MVCWVDSANLINANPWLWVVTLDALLEFMLLEIGIGS